METLRRLTASDFELTDEGLTYKNGECVVRIVLLSKIEDNLSDPCFKQVLNLLRTTQFNLTLKNILSNFDLNKKIELSFSNYSFGETSTDADHIIERMPNDYSDGAYAVTLNDDALRNCSQEYIAVTILHEVIHAYFSSRPSYQKWKEARLDHNQMAVTYVEPMAQSLVNLFNIDMDLAISLSWGAYTKL